MITLNDGLDYKLTDGCVYIYTGKHTVVVDRVEEGVVVDIYESGFEDRDPVATTYAMDCEVECA